jgi:hypothetical protein
VILKVRKSRKSGRKCTSQPPTAAKWTESSQNQFPMQVNLQAMSTGVIHGQSSVYLRAQMFRTPTFRLDFASSFRFDTERQGRLQYQDSYLARQLKKSTRSTS